MSEFISKIEKEDIKVPHLQAGESAIVLQRHEKYSRDRSSEFVGSLLPEAAEAARQRYLSYFRELFLQDAEAQTMVLFVASDTQYGGGGYRSMETAQLAQDAARSVLEEMQIEPSKRIININSHFRTLPFAETGQDIRPDRRIVEPDIFNTPEYVEFLREKYGRSDGPGGMTQKAWAMHEMDADAEAREGYGAEGVHDVVTRVKKSLAVMKRYSQAFHASNPDKKLLIWMASHYDTISPLVKDIAELDFGQYLPVDNGGGILIQVAPGEDVLKLEVANRSIFFTLN